MDEDRSFLSLVEEKGTSAQGKIQIQINLNKDIDDFLKRLAFSCGMSKKTMAGKMIEKFIHDPDQMTSLIKEFKPRQENIGNKLDR